MKKTPIVAGLIAAAGLVTAGPAAAAPDSNVSCSPVILCTITSNVDQFTGSVGAFITQGPKTFQDSIVNGPQTFNGSVNDFITKGPKTFRDSITNPGGQTG
jgi:ABC-type sugar transport system substrate-binding protein